MSVKINTNKTATWVNAAGDAVPLKFVPKIDKEKEALAGKIHKTATAVEASLNALYELMDDAFTHIRAMIKAEYELKNKTKKKEGKGSLTWYNFDRSIKVEADMNDIVKWDSALMTEALEHLNKYLSSGLTDTNLLIQGLVKSAFSNRSNMIDSGKVFQILKHQPDIKNATFQKACELMRNAQSIDKTRLYMRVWEKLTTGEYRNINLNFSSI